MQEGFEYCILGIGPEKARGFYAIKAHTTPARWRCPQSCVHVPLPVSHFLRVEDQLGGYHTVK
jgi:hypothetical protein